MVFKAFKKAAGVVADIATGGSYSSYRASKHAKEAQKEHQAKQQAELAKQKKEALEKRKSNINKMREQIGVGSYSTRRTSAKGIRGRLKDEESLG